MSKEEESVNKKKMKPARNVDRNNVDRSKNSKTSRSVKRKSNKMSKTKTDKIVRGETEKIAHRKVDKTKVDRTKDGRTMDKKDYKEIKDSNYRESKVKKKNTMTKDTGINKKSTMTKDAGNNKKKSDLHRKNEFSTAGKSEKINENWKSKKVLKSNGSCPNNRQCGSCQMMQKSYKEHLKEKQKYVDTLIKKFCPVAPIIGMDKPYHYRNKVHVVFDHDRKGNPISGIYEEHTHDVIPIEGCLIHNKKADEIINSIRGMLKSFKIKTYDEDTGYGFLRHVLVRSGFTSGEIMVVLVVASPIFPSKNNFIKALRKQHPEITTIVVNVNNKKTSMVLGEKEQVIYGKGYIEDSLCGKVFRISPKSFYQVNPVQTEVLYKKAIEFAMLNGTETVIDAYCGIGTIGLIASDHAKKVISVEVNKDAVKDARINAKRNQVKNVDFYNNDAGEFMSQMAAQQETADVVFLDPPRAGSDEKFLNSLVQLKPERVVYISCNPVTLERDMQYLIKKGYKAEKAAPVDMFPWTGHVESIILMTYCGSRGKK